MAVATKSNKAEATKVAKKVQAVELSEQGVKALKAFNKAKASIKRAEALKAKAEKAVREALGEAEIGVHEGIEVVKIAHRKNTWFDRKLMKELYPEAFEATLKETEYDFLDTI